MEKLKQLGLVCLSIFVIVGCAVHESTISTTTNNNDLPTIIERTRDSVIVLISSLNDNLEVDLKQNGMCSGAVIELQYVITNFHCIYKQKYLRVYFWDKEDWNEYEVEVIGEDPLADLALLKILNKDTITPHLKFYKDEIKEGEEVFAIGHPMGMIWTVTKGIISSTNRYSKHPYITAVQTDAAINQGNSGGPLLNMKGEIVGINSSIISKIKENAGIGLAIRADIVEKSYKIMLSKGKVDRPAIGVMIAPLLREKQRKSIAEKQAEIKIEDIPNTFGLLIIKTEDMPIGLKIGDVIVGVNGVPINNGMDLSEELIKYNIGEEVSLTIIRNKMFKKVKVPLQVLKVPTEKLYSKK
tara:strand:+ start:124 stop:1188 length:1065 start_codon:yes stop_codon:yes gene_type:complete